MEETPSSGFQVGCRPEQRAAEEIRLVPHAGQREEIAAADGLDVFLQRLAIEAALDGDEARVEVGLIGDEEEALVELTVRVMPFE